MKRNKNSIKKRIYKCYKDSLFSSFFNDSYAYVCSVQYTSSLKHWILIRHDKNWWCCDCILLLDVETQFFIQHSLSVSVLVLNIRFILYLFLIFDHLQWCVLVTGHRIKSMIFSFFFFTWISRWMFFSVPFTTTVCKCTIAFVIFCVYTHQIIVCIDFYCFSKKRRKKNYIIILVGLWSFSFFFRSL